MPLSGNEPRQGALCSQTSPWVDGPIFIKPAPTQPPFPLLLWSLNFVLDTELEFLN